MNSFQERLYEHHSQLFTVDAVPHRSRTAFQDVLVFENRLFGRVALRADDAASISIDALPSERESPDSMIVPASGQTCATAPAAIEKWEESPPN
jgi:hypothetical protein